eukprot:COSAG02_NODE_64_length_43111_cov_35.627709_19_plen_92_part_00
MDEFEGILPSDPTTTTTRAAVAREEEAEEAEEEAAGEAGEGDRSYEDALEAILHSEEGGVEEVRDAFAACLAGPGGAATNASEHQPQRSIP